MDYYVGIDVGGTNVKYGLLDEAGNVLNKGKVKTSEKGDEIIESIQGIVKEYASDYEIKAVGVSAPGIIEDDGFMTTGGAIFDFYGINLKEILEEKVGFPVFIENDANSAALAERWIGAGRDKLHFLCVVVGTGIGGGIIINGQLYKGANSNAGEFGFMVVEPPVENDTRLASLSLTGSVGCGIVNKYEEQHPKGERLNGEQIFELAKQGDELGLSVIDTFYDRLAKGIFNLSTSFDPEVILLGGAISTNQEFINEVQNRVLSLQKGHRDMKNIKLPPIEACRFLNDAGIIGAVYKAVSESKCV